MHRKTTLSRRDILRLTLALSGLLLLDGVRKFLSYSAPAGAPTRQTLNLIASYAPGSVTMMPGGRGWVVRDEDGLYAVSAVCPHLGCLVQHDDDRFACPCHGSAFRLNGRVIVGPANKPLQHVAVSRAADDRLVVDTTVPVPANQRLSG